MKERGCFLIKPDGVERKVIGKVIDRFENEGFKLIALKMIQPDRELFENFYSVHRGKAFFEGFLEFMLSGPTIAMVWEGVEVISRGRKMIGATNSAEAEAGTIRQLYGTDNRRNVVHGSDSPSSAEREIDVLFKKEELWTNTTESLQKI